MSVIQPNDPYDQVLRRQELDSVNWELKKLDPSNIEAVENRAHIINDCSGFIHEATINFRVSCCPKKLII